MACLVLLTAPAMLLRSIARASVPRRWASSALRGCAAVDHGEVVAAAERRCSAEPAALAAIRAETDAAFPSGAHMVSGAQQGRLLHALVRLARARRVLEVGASTGYATRWMELGMEDGGRVVAGDDAAGAEPPFDLVVWHVGDAGVGDLPAADLLAPHGLLVVVQPSADGAIAAAVHDALAEGPLEYVTLPSPDGDGGVLTLAMAVA